MLLPKPRPKCLMLITAALNLAVGASQLLEAPVAPRKSPRYFSARTNFIMHISGPFALSLSLNVVTSCCENLLSGNTQHFLKLSSKDETAWNCRQIWMIPGP